MALHTPDLTTPTITAGTRRAAPGRRSVRRPSVRRPGSGRLRALARNAWRRRDVLLPGITPTEQLLTGMHEARNLNR